MKDRARNFTSKLNECKMKLEAVKEADGVMANRHTILYAFSGWAANETKYCEQIKNAVWPVAGYWLQIHLVGTRVCDGRVTLPPLHCVP